MVCTNIDEIQQIFKGLFGSCGLIANEVADSDVFAGNQSKLPPSI
jgi:hypothetical protein